MYNNTLTDTRKPLSRTLSQHLLIQKLDTVKLPAIEKKRCVLTRKGDVFEKKFVDTIMGSQSTKNSLYNTFSTGFMTKALQRSLSKPDAIFSKVSTQAKIAYIDDMCVKLKTNSCQLAAEKKGVKKLRWDIVDGMEKDRFLASKLREVATLKKAFDEQSNANAVNNEQLSNSVKQHSRELNECYARYYMLLEKYERLKKFKGQNSSL